MTSIILRDVGSAVGNAFLPGIGGAFLGTLGQSLGGLVDSKLGLGSSYQGPQLQNLSVQDSRYGAGIPVTYGQVRVAGNIIWSTDLIQASHTSSFSGGKGGGGSVSTTTYTYSVHCASGIALGPIGGIATIWADSTIIYQNGVWTAGVVDSATIYTGGTAQTPDAFMESIIGAGQVPAYRGLAYVVFENFQLANFGNRLPNLTFEIVPDTVTTNASWLGGVDANVSQRQQTASCGGMLPIPLQSGGDGVQAVLAGGYVQSGSTAVFEVVEYDVTGETPVELARISSSGFTASDPADTSWALGPDSRTVALYYENGTVVSHALALYDTETQQFGAITAPTLAVSTLGMRQIAWLDPQHVIVDDVVGGVRGVHVFAVAGLGFVDLGFFGVWGAGSGTSRLPLGYAQTTPFAGGVMNYMTDNASGTYFSAIYACPLSWQSGTLALGTPYTIVSGLSTGSGSGPTPVLVATGEGEWTLCLGTVIDYHLISFVPGANSATVTRPWQDFTLASTGTTNFPLYYGDRLVIVQRTASENNYRLSEVMLEAGSFNLTLNGAFVTSTTPASRFGAIVLDISRLLFLGIGGFNSDVQQLGIIQRCPEGDGLDAIMVDILMRAGYAGGDYDVSSLAGVSVAGYVLPGPLTARSAIEPLQVYLPFDLIESAGMLRAVTRGGSSAAAIPSSEWRAAPYGKEPPPALDITRAQELDLPLEVDVDYIDPARDFEVNSQRARRIASRAQSVQKISLPIVCDSTLAKQIAEVRLYSLWAERELIRIMVSRRWLALDPGDVVDLANGNMLRVTGVDQAGGLLQVQGFYADPAVYASLASADGGQGVVRTLPVPIASLLTLMDIPLLQATDDQPGVYAAATGLPGWNGASLWRASDGINYSAVASLPTVAVAGIATTALGNQPCLTMDRVSTVNVQLVQGSLSSCTQTDLLNGTNAALIGSEIVQFETATLIGPGLYQLSSLLRGRRGTEWAAGTHTLGESFVMLMAGAVEFVPALLTDRGREYEFRTLTKGQSLGDTQDSDFTYGLMTIKPFSPVNLSGARASGPGTDLTITWMRRARLNADWVDYVDVPLDEDEELYEVDIMNGGTIVRIFSPTSPTVTYTAAEQGADWPGGIPASFSVNVYQISARYGRGWGCVASL